MVCPFNCGGMASIADEERLTGKIERRPRRSCKGTIKEYEKFAFAGLAAARLRTLPDWTEMIELNFGAHPEADRVIRVVEVSSSTISLSQNDYSDSLQRNRFFSIP